MLIALGHKARNGKDTAGEAIVEFYNNRRSNAVDFLSKGEWTPHYERLYPAAKIFKFADALYQVCREEYGMVGKDANLLQTIGDGRRQELGQDYWINKLAPKINSFKGIAVITDMRYTNEADWVKSQNGHTVNVRRLNEDGSPYITTDRDPNFISEIQLDSYNYDHYIVTKSAALTGEFALTLSEYLRGLEC